MAVTLLDTLPTTLQKTGPEEATPEEDVKEVPRAASTFTHVALSTVIEVDEVLLYAAMVANLAVFENSIS